MKKILIPLMLAAILFSTLTGCTAPVSPSSETPSQSAAGANPDDAEKKPLVIGVAMNKADEMRTQWRNLFVEAAEKKGYVVHVTNADNSVDKQLSDIDSLIARSPDVIVVTPVNSSGTVSGVDAIASAGIPSIIIDFEIDTENYTTRVADEVGYAGVIQGEFLLKWLEEKPDRVANVGYFVGSYEAESAMPRMTDFYKAIEGNSKVKKLAEAEAQWKADVAMSMTEDWLQTHPEMNVFACMNDEMAIGCIQALKAAGKNMEDVVVMGVDGTTVGIEHIKAGELDCTAARDLKKETATALETAEKVANKEAVDKRIYPKATIPMTKENVSS